MKKHTKYASTSITNNHLMTMYKTMIKKYTKYATRALKLVNYKKYITSKN